MTSEAESSDGPVVAGPVFGGIVFDFDGTIADTEWGVYLVVRDAFRAHGLDVTLQEWVALIGRADNGTLEDMLGGALGGPPDPEVMVRATARREHHRRTAPLMPGVLDVLDAAASASLPLAVASSSGRDWVEGHLERLGIRHRFGPVRTRDDVDRGKPAPDLYLAAAGALGVDPDRVLAIEDSRHGCRAAKAAGMTCVVVPNRITRLDPAPDADLIVDSLAELPLADFGLA